MWVFTTTGFVSVVQHRVDPSIMIVRARFAGDAARFLGLPSCAEEVTPTADYRFRCYAHRDVVSAALLAASQAIDYGNFKSAIEEDAFAHVASDVWSVLYREQAARLRPPLQCGFADDEWLPGPPRSSGYLYPERGQVELALAGNPEEASL